MRFDEYQERRRMLEEQLQADFELIRSAHRTKLRALELLWLSSAEEVAAASTPPLESQEQAETQAVVETQRGLSLEGQGRSRGWKFDGQEIHDPAEAHWAALRGSVIRYTDPLEPVGMEDWESTDLETVSLSTSPEFLELIQSSRSRHAQHGGLSRTEIRRHLEEERQE